MNNNVSFTSLLRPVSLTEFTKASDPLYCSAFVKHPWTAKESIIAKEAFTMDVFDCSAGGIIDEKNKRVFLFHICPEMKENKCLSEIAQHISGAFSDVKEGLRAFMIGSNKMFKDSEAMYENIRGAILKRNLPLSEFRGASDKTHILYNAAKDEWLISSSDINTRIRKGELPKDFLKECFDEVVIDGGDALSRV